MPGVPVDWRAVADPRLQFGPAAEKYLHSAVHSNEAALRRMIEVVQPRGGAVMDVATGAGHTAFAFAPCVDWVMATDLTIEMAELTRRTARSRGLKNVDVCLALAERMPFRSESFDGLCCRMAAHHFRDVVSFLTECRRVLKPHGWLLIVDNVGVDDPEADEQLDRIEFLRDPSHVRYYREGEWRDMIAAAGFKLTFEETAPKPINAPDWLERMNTPHDTREVILEAVVNSSGWLREYLRPHGEGDLLTFHLNEALFFARK
jgi:ubiquinone/menaquinone biosynthesis C-methylase UbiE